MTLRPIRDTRLWVGVATSSPQRDPPAKARRLHVLIAGSELRVIPRARHSAPVEEPAAVTAALSAFFARHA